MGIFEVLSEAKIKEWLSKPKTNTAVPLKKSEDEKPEKTLESHLLDDIKSLIIKASQEDKDERSQTLKKVNGLEMQLLISLENEGQRFMAKKTELIIFNFKQSHLFKSD